MSRAADYGWGLAALSGRIWSPHLLRRYQSARLRSLVRHCASDVPLYRQRFEHAGISPEAFRGLDDLHRLPIVERSEMQRARLEDVIARSCRVGSLVVHRTSGSSGVPLGIRRSRFEDWLLRGLRLEAEMAQGYRPWDRTFCITRTRNRPAYIWHRLGLLRRQTVDCLEPLPSILSQLRSAAPTSLAGYSGMVAAVAAALTEEDRRRFRMRVILCGAETLTAPMRRVIHDAFGHAPREAYASHEFNLIAAECPTTGLLHVAGTSVVVEVLRGDEPVGDGESGEAVVTALHSYAMPFVRYRLADVVTKGPERCPCGAPFATLRAVHGRVIEMFQLPDGRQLHPYAFVEQLTHHAPWVRQYQLIQERPDFVRVRVVGLEQATLPQRADLLARLQQRSGPDVHVVLEKAESIGPESNGKFRPYYSLVTPIDLRPRAAGPSAIDC